MVESVGLVDSRQSHYSDQLGNTHWTLGAIFVQLKRVCFYDSFHSSGQKYLDAMWQWGADEVKIKHEAIWDKSEWHLESIQETPTQLNGTDYGLFTIMCADYLMDNLPICEESFGQENMEFFRLKIVNDIIRGYLDYPAMQI